MSNSSLSINDKLLTVSILWHNYCDLRGYENEFV